MDRYTRLRGMMRESEKLRQRVQIGRAEARATLLDQLEGFLARHTGGEDLGLRLRGAQLEAGVRFVRMVREGTYDLVVANPPYQGTSKMADAGYVAKTYPLGKADLYAAFLLRGLELVREGGVSAMPEILNGAPPEPSESESDGDSDGSWPGLVTDSSSDGDVA